LNFVETISKGVVEERSVARAFILKGRKEDYDRFAVLRGQFDERIDSLQRELPKDELQAVIEVAKKNHEAFVSHLTALYGRVGHGEGIAPVEFLVEASTLSDSVIVHIQNLRSKQLLLLTKQMNNSARNRETTGELATMILLFSMIVSSAWVYFIGRMLIRPIFALKSGAQKVGEGKYETVRVTTTDEVGELTHAFNLMSSKLKELDEMRMQMMSEISHEMRTPLQVIKAGCHAIIHAKDGPKLTQRQVDAVGMIHGATNRINSFVNLFLDVAKMEAGLMKFNFEPVNIVELVTPLINEAALIAQTRQIKVEFDAGEIGVLPLDKDRFTQALTNLLSNALKYTPNEGAVTISMKIAADIVPMGKGERRFVRIDVRDTGVGIPPADLDKLFNKFYQAKNTPFVKEKGSGLGLALVKHVAEAHGGRVSVTSQVGVGSVFSIILPLG
jgi:two-component system sensor histidine kinase GlrK